MKFFLLLLLACTPSFATEALEVYIYGNVLYEEETIRQIAGLEFEKAPSEAEMKQKLETTGYFSSVRISREGNRLTIFVREKFPWLLLPYFSSDDDTKIYGIAGGMVGLQGNHAKLLGRYQRGREHTVASFFYRDDFFYDSRFIIGYSMDYEKARHDIYQGRNVSQRLRNQELNHTIQTGYHLSPNLILQLDTHFETHSFDEPNGQHSKGQQLSHRIFVEYGNFYLNEGLAKGYWIKPYFEFTTPLSDYKFYQLGIFGQWSVLRNGDFNWITKPRVEYGKPQPFYQKFEVGGAKLRSFPAQIFRSHAYGAIQSDFLLFCLDIWRLKFRPMVYLDWAYIDGGGRTGLGAGLQMYFRNVAFPALQINAGYGFHPNGFSFSAALGPQF